MVKQWDERQSESERLQAPCDYFPRRETTFLPQYELIIIVSTVILPILFFECPSSNVQFNPNHSILPLELSDIRLENNYKSLTLLSLLSKVYKYMYMYVIYMYCRPAFNLQQQKPKIYWSRQQSDRELKLRAEPEVWMYAKLIDLAFIWYSLY